MGGFASPSQTTVDPLRGQGRNLSNGIFSTFLNEFTSSPGNPSGQFNPNQAPAFQQLFGGGGGGMPGMYPGRGPMGPHGNGGGNPGAIPSSGTRLGASVNAGNFMRNQPGTPPTIGPVPGATADGNGNVLSQLGQQPFMPAGAMPTLGMDPGAAQQNADGFGGSINASQGGTMPSGGGGPFGEGIFNFRQMLGGGSRGFDGGLDVFNLPQWQGPLGAGMTGMQMDAMAGLQQMIGNNPLVSNEMLSGAIGRNLNGNPAFDPSGGQTLGQAVQPYELPTQTGSVFERLLGLGGDGAGGGAGGSTSRLNPILDQITPDVVSSFQTALQPGGAATGQGQAAMDGAINLALARANEQASGMGLSPGSIDRSALMAGEAADVAARLGIQQQQADTQSISAQNQDRIGALNSAGAFENLLNSDFRNQYMRDSLAAGVLPSMMQQENSAFERMMQVQEPAAQRGLSTLGMLPGMREIPLNEMERMFGMGEAGRRIADEQILRAMQESARTQGQGLNMALSALGGIPGVNVAMGPSPMSQLAGLVGGGASALSGTNLKG